MGLKPVKHQFGDCCYSRPKWDRTRYKINILVAFFVVIRIFRLYKGGAVIRPESDLFLFSELKLLLIAASRYRSSQKLCFTRKIFQCFRYI